MGMEKSNYRIECSDIMVGPLLPSAGSTQVLVHDRGLATVVAAKSVTIPYGREIRVVLVDTGEVVFRKTAAQIA
jgi:hypothetical protein